MKSKLSKLDTEKSSRQLTPELFTQDTIFILNNKANNRKTNKGFPPLLNRQIQKLHLYMHAHTQFNAPKRGFAQNKGDLSQARKLREGDAHPITELREKGVIKPHR